MMPVTVENGSAVVYIALGWFSILAMPELVEHAGVTAIVLVGLGGLFYTAGAVVYATQRPDPVPTVFGYHEVFHALVIAAAVVHFIAMAGWVVPSAGA